MMKRIILTLGLSVLLTSCASGAKFLSEIEDAPAWFIEQIPEAEAEGYPTMAETPQAPDDVAPLSSWEAKLEALTAKGDAVTADSRAMSAPNGVDTRQFLEDSLQRADVEQFNAEEDAKFGAEAEHESE